MERAYYAVFDGHGGVDAATYAATHLHVTLAKQETLQSDVATAFKTAFKHTDDMFRGKAKREVLKSLTHRSPFRNMSYNLFMSVHFQRLRSGTTGVVVLIQGQQLAVAWLGDSQAMLVRRGQIIITLMDPHKPDREVGIGYTHKLNNSCLSLFYSKIFYELCKLFINYVI